jgi:hypothetical protein
VAFFCLALALAACGCTKDSRSLSFDEELARESCKKALDTWKAGGVPDEVQPMIVGDFNWKSGAKLVDYQIVEDRSDGKNLHVTVRLKLKSNKAEPSESEVVYIVGTDPVITMFPE